jgi:glycosyltransferase involved in cell wall biosynthesis
MRPLRVLLAGVNSSVIGGAESYQQAVMSGLRDRGIHAARLAERPPVAYAQPVSPPEAAGPAWTVGSMGAAAALEQAAAWAPDVVYAHGFESPDLERALLARWPTVLFAHGYYGTCATGTKRHAFPRIAFCTRRLGPGCLLLHYPRRCGGLNPAAAVRLYRRQRTRYALLTRYDAVCVASGHMRAEYQRHGVAPDRLHVLPLPPAGIVPQQAPPVPRTSPAHVVMVGRLTDLKGGALLVDALPAASRRLGRPLTLTVVGDGPERPRLEQRARHHGVRARFCAWVEASERNAMLRDADLLALPSLWPEPWGLVGLEAACVGVPTVAFAAGGIPEWLGAGESGELASANPPTASGLADAIVRALQDPAHYAGLCRGAWERARRHTVEAHVTALLSVLDAARRRSPTPPVVA